MPERHLCSKLTMNMVSVRVAVVLETLVGRVICGVKLFEKSISRKWLIPRVCVFKLIQVKVSCFFFFFDFIKKVVHKIVVKFKILHAGMLINQVKYVTWFIWKGNFNDIVSYRVGTPLFLREPPFSEANLKSYPLFLTAIQIGLCKLYKTL